MAKNIVLIGMPGTGKTTVGQEISKRTGLNYIDTDELIKASCNMPLKEYVAEYGMEAFLKLQNKVICEMKNTDSVISTGGGVILDSTVMEHLMKTGYVFYLDTPFDVLEARLAPDRRLARKNGESFRDVFEKRKPLYKKYSQFCIDCRDKAVPAVTDEICTILNDVKGDTLC